MSGPLTFSPLAYLQ